MSWLILSQLLRNSPGRFSDGDTDGIMVSSEIEGTVQINFHIKLFWSGFGFAILEKETQETQDEAYQCYG